MSYVFIPHNLPQPPFSTPTRSPAPQLLSSFTAALPPQPPKARSATPLRVHYPIIAPTLNRSPRVTVQRPVPHRIVMHACNPHLIHKSTEAAGDRPHEMIPSNKRQAACARARTWMDVRVCQQPHAFERVQSVLCRVHIRVVAREPRPAAHCHANRSVHVSAIVPPLLRVDDYAHLKLL